MKSSVYPAKVDWWLWLVLAGCSAGLIVWGVLAWDNNRTGAMVLIGAGIFDGILFAVLLFPCRYAIEAHDVLIRCGVINYRIPISQIRSVTPSWNPLSAPATSLKRVEIRLENGSFHLVSPADREGFIRELQERAGL